VLVAPRGVAPRDQLLIRGAVLGERQQVRPQQRRHLQRAPRSLGLADLDPEQLPDVVQIADHAIGDLRRPHPHQERGQCCHRALVASGDQANRWEDKRSVSDWIVVTLQAVIAEREERAARDRERPSKRR
jgi:hypothetical protein